MLNKLKAVLQNTSPNLRKILGNISWLLAERILRMIVGFFVLAWMARYLGAEQFGVLNYAIAFVSIFTTFAQLGLNHIVVRDSVSELSSKDEILGTAFFLRLSSGVGAFLLATASIFLLRPDDPLSRVLVVIVAASLIFQEFDVIDFWFQSQIQSKYAVLAKNTAFIIMTLVRIALLRSQAPLVTFAWAFLVESALTVIGLVIVYQRSGQKIQAWHGKWLRAKSLMKVSWPLIFSNLAIVVYLRIDQVMLGQLADDNAVGVYSVAVRLSEVWPFMATAVVRSVASSIIEAKKVSEELYYEKIQQVSNLLVLMVYVIAIPITFFSTHLITLVFGPEYSAAGVVLSIHIWSSVFVFLGYVKEVWIATEELAGYALVSSFVGAAINISLNLWLIPIYREAGAAIATVISYGCADYVMCFLYPQARKFGMVMTKAMALNVFTQIKMR
ncbi:oligosaccharide flippase family protein [Lyngbya aestuarii]|uniref:oligosaccharide flippase family protein n=1 Tax=Lyngbya aestuarii TaxID=118322 RepID=UPI00403D783D